MLTGEIKNTLNHIAIFPASHYVVPKERMEKAIKNIEIELEEQVKYFKGEDKTSGSPENCGANEF